MDVRSSQACIKTMHLGNISSYVERVAENLPDTIGVKDFDLGCTSVVLARVVCSVLAPSYHHRQLDGSVFSPQRKTELGKQLLRKIRFVQLRMFHECDLYLLVDDYFMDMSDFFCRRGK